MVLLRLDFLHFPDSGNYALTPAVNCKDMAKAKAASAAPAAQPAAKAKSTTLLCRKFMLVANRGPFEEWT